VSQTANTYSLYLEVCTTIKKKHNDEAI